MFGYAHKIYRGDGEPREPAIGQPISIYNPETKPIVVAPFAAVNQLSDWFIRGIDHLTPLHATCPSHFKLAIAI